MKEGESPSLLIKHNLYINLTLALLSTLETGCFSYVYFYNLLIINITSDRMLLQKQKGSDYREERNH